MMNHKPADRYLALLGFFTDLLKVFGLENEVLSLFGNMSEDDRKDRLQQIKKLVKSEFHKQGGLAYESHPDHGGTTEAFAAVKRVYDTIQNFDLYAKFSIVMVECPTCKGRGYLEQLQS